MARPRTGEAPTADTSVRDGRLLALRVIAFVAGAVLMALEVVGSRVLAPHFGNSVFVWGSLITVVLAALAGGYYLGGHLADRRPSLALLVVLTALAGLLILLIPAVGHPVCRRIVAAGLAERGGPLASSLLLFLPASFVLGMVSPFSVRLAAASVESVGRVAGTLYALSTVGSIAGTLATTFVLIPNLGTVRILKGLGAVLLALAAVLVAWRPGASRRHGAGERLGPAALVLALAAGGSALPASPADRPAAGDRILVDAESAYHHIRVIESAGGERRYLKFDRFVEGGIGTRPPYPTLMAYTDYFQLAFLVRPEMRRVLFLGLGAGNGPRSFAEQDPELSIDVVDVDSRVLALAGTHFHFPIEGRVRGFARDARAFLLASEGGYDLIALDAFSVGGRIPFHLVTAEFFELARSRLAPGGVFAMNVNGTLAEGGSAMFRAVARTVAEVFPGLLAFSTMPWRQAQAIVLVASMEDRRLGPDEWRSRIERFPARGRTGRAEIAAMVERLVWPPIDLSGVEPLRDDFVPVETMPLGF